MMEFAQIEMIFALETLYVDMRERESLNISIDVPHCFRESRNCKQHKGIGIQKRLVYEFRNHLVFYFRDVCELQVLPNLR